MTAGPDVAVSVVISNFNYARFVRVAIDSALAQTHPGTEVVVVDDGSTDDSRSIIASYGDDIRAIRQDNAGQAAAMNAGVAAARGTLVLFLDADDTLDPEAAEALAAAWRPGVGRVQARVRLIDADGRPAGGHLPSDPIPDGDAARLVVRSGGYGATGTTGAAYARDCLDRLLPIPEDEWRVAPDTYLLTLAPFVAPVAAVERVLGNVRIHGSNKWSMERLAPERLLEHVELDRKRESLLRGRGATLGANLPGDWLLRTPNHLQSRLALLRLAPHLTPYPRDRRLALALRGMRAALAHEGFAVRKRLFFAAWFLAAGLAPRPMAGGVVRRGYIRTARPTWLQRFIERGRRPAGGAA